jgi:hypothetical protein
MSDGIVRSLTAGPDYMPDWRFRIVQNYLTEIAAAPDSNARLAAIVEAEKDPFIRQFLRYRFYGTSVNSDAFKYAVGCQSRNQSSGAASIIKAMIVADRTPDEIAEELGTNVRNVVAFAKIYFDARRYLNNEAWLGRIVFAEPQEGMTQVEALRERRWLAAAYHRGWDGVQQVVFHRTSSKPRDVEELSMLLQSTLASRALEYALELETSGTAATEADLHRFLAARSTQALATETKSDSQSMAITFIRALHSDVVKKAEESPDDPSLGFLRDLKQSNRHEISQPPKRMRTRFANS